MKPLKWISMVAFLLVILVTAACGGKGPAPLSTASNAALPLVLTNPDNSASPSVEAMRTTLTTAFLALGSQKSYRYRSTMLIGGKTYQTMIEYMPPDKKHIVTDSGEYIVTTDKVYVKDGDTWKVSNTLTPATFQDDLASLTEKAENIQWIGKDTLDGKAMQAIQFEVKTTDAGKETTQQIKLWVAEGDGLPYKMVITGSAVGVDQTTGQTSQVQAVSNLLFEYDQSIQIFIPVIK
jgi:predicted small lipoprotein YifL